MDFPSDLHYTKDHEWIRIDGETGWIGITAFAQNQLGDVVLVELPAVGDTLNTGDSFGVVESVKTVSDLYAPLSGRVTETNQALLTAPETVNNDPYRAGWMIQLALTQPTDLSNLMTADAYRAYVEAE